MGHTVGHVTCNDLCVRSIGRALLRRPTTPGVVVGAIFWWFSLVPTLMPRSWIVQAAISAICLGIGYALGTLGGWIVRRVRGDRPPLTTGLGERLRARMPERVPVWAVIAAPAALLVIVGCLFWVRWQDQQRDLLAMDAVAPASTIPMIVLTVLLTMVLGLIGRLIGGGVRRLDRWNHRHLPGPLALPTTIVLVLVVSGFLLRDVAADAFVTWADRSFSIVDSGTNDGTEQPTTDTVSGGSDSLVEWDDLGLQGRDFVAQATSDDDLRAFAEQVGADPDDVVAPVRAYAGIESEDDIDERARLAVADLERAGGFDREVLVVATSTGTGWIDPDASRSIELMHGGDTAIVSMQYSFLPSWISFITDLDRAEDAGAALYQAVYDEWASRPEAARPKLIAFGLSLGSFGASAAFTGQDADTSIANMVSRSDGALFVGTPYATELLRQLVDERDAGSPAWVPVIDEGTTVRFSTRDPNQPTPSAEWEQPHVLFFQHPSDPVTHWYYNWLWSTPDWMDDPRGFDVPGRAGWFPIVTGVQGVFDLMAGFSAPPGHGHDYRLDYPSAWADVVAPDGWSDDDTAALEAFTAAERAVQAADAAAD
jgi:uncharacterized membrane protein